MPATPTTPKPGDDERAHEIGLLLRQHQPTTGVKVAMGETCRCGYWSGVETAGVTRPVGYNTLQWHHAQLLAALTLPAPETVQVSRSAIQTELDRHEYVGDNMCECGESWGGTTDGVVWTSEQNRHIAEALLASALFALPVEVEQVKALDPEPWTTTGFGTRNRFAVQSLVGSWIFSPRPEYSQDRADYQTGGE